MRYDLTAQQIATVMAMLPDDGDEQLRADSIEGETDLHAFVSRILDWIEDDEDNVNALDQQIAVRKIRMERAKARALKKRDMIQSLMEMAKLDKLMLPEATVSIRDVAPKVIFPQTDLVPDEFCKFERKLDRDKLKSVDPENLPSWATIDNGGKSLTVRRK